MKSVLATYRASTTAAIDANPGHRTVLYIFTALAGLLAIQILHLALDDLKINVALSIALLCGFVYSYYLSPKYRPVTTYMVSLLSLLICFYYIYKWQDEQTMYGNFLGIFGGILIALLAFKAFSPGDHRFILMFCVVFLLFSSVASYDLKFMGLLPVFLLVSGCSLYVSNQIDISLRVSGTTGQRIRLNLALDIGFGWVLLRAVVGIIILSSIGYIFAPHGSGAQSNMILTAAPTVNRPQENTDTQGQTQPSNTEANDEVEIGLGDDFDLTDSRRLSTNPRPVLKLRAHRAGYLRAQVYDIYTGAGWEKSVELQTNLAILSQKLLIYQPAGSDAASFQVPLVDFPGETYAEELKSKHKIKVISKESFLDSSGYDNTFSNDDIPDLDYDIIRQEITLLEDQAPYYFAMYQPFKLENISLDQESQRLDTPLLDRASILRPLDLEQLHPQDFTYTVFSLEPRATRAELEQSFGKPKEEIRRLNTQLPLTAEPIKEEIGGLRIRPDDYRQISSRLQNFATGFAQTPGADDPNAGSTAWDTVSQIYDYLTDPEEFTYTRQFDPLDTDAEITEAFCMGPGPGEGYCRYFASSMAVLCRLNGIPARLVTGYAPGSYSLIENAYVYKASNAHVWVEVYFEGYGWIMFDPSPTSVDVNNQNEAGQFLANVVDFLQELFVIDPASTRETIISSMMVLWHYLLSNVRISLVIVVCLLMVLGMFWLLGKVRRRQRYVPLVPENPVVFAYIEVKRLLELLGFAVDQSDTARNIARRVQAEFPVISEPVAGLVPIYEAAAFSPGSPDDEQSEQAGEFLRKVSEFTMAEIRRRKEK